QSQRNITKLTLQSLNLNVNYLEAGNGQEALEIMKTELVAGVITDYEMPVMNGMEMIKEMRKSSRLSTVPVIMITSIKGSEPEAYANGITYWLLKPYVQND